MSRLAVVAVAGLLFGAFAEAQSRSRINAAGPVSTVSATAPVASSGGAAPTLSMTAAGAGTSGYLTDSAGELVADAGLVSLVGLRPKPHTLTTCGASIEGRLETDSLAGAGTGKRTKPCVCSSAGDAGYAWQNLATATIGTTTTCGTE